MSSGVPPVGPIGPADPVRGVGDRRLIDDRREAERRAGAGEKPRSKSRAVVPAGEVVDHEPSPAASAARPETPGAAAAFAAQMIGQDGQRRGIRGGPPLMDAARSTYLSAEYSGENDRRPPTGKAKRTEV